PPMSKRTVDQDRSAIVTIGGTDFELVLTTRATREICGHVEKLRRKQCGKVNGQKFQESSDGEQVREGLTSAEAYPIHE
ncbi:hypothetical protein Q604_UNBC11413G0001, partial [human gut metagenome]